jgi:hypothetical protein
MRRAPFIPRKILGTHFCQRLSRSQGHSAAGRLGQWKIPVISSEILITKLTTAFARSWNLSLTIHLTSANYVFIKMIVRVFNVLPESIAVRRLLQVCFIVHCTPQDKPHRWQTRRWRWLLSKTHLSYDLKGIAWFKQERKVFAKCTCSPSCMSWKSSKLSACCPPAFAERDWRRFCKRLVRVTVICWQGGAGGGVPRGSYPSALQSANQRKLRQG